MMKLFKTRRAASGDFAWALCGNVAYSFCQWAFVVVLARAGTANDVGEYALGLAISAPLLTFANCQGRNLVASDIENKYTFGDYLGFRILSMIVAMVGVLGIAIWTRPGPAMIAVICLLGLSQAFDWISETYFGLMQKNDHLDWVGQSLMWKGSLCLLLLASAMYATRSLMWAALGLVAGRGFTLLFFDVRKGAPTESARRAKWNYRTITPLLRSALPLGVISVIAALNLNIPRYFIEAHLNNRELGIFSATASLVGAGNLVMSALGNSSFVGIARAVALRDRQLYRTLSIRLVGTAAALGLLGVAVSQIAGREILVRLFRPEYGVSAGVLTRLMLAGGLNYIISGQGYALTAARVLTPQVWILMCAAITTTLLCRWLVPLRGTEGAAEATLLSSLVTLGVSSLILVRVQVGNGKSEILAQAARQYTSEVV